MSSQQQPTLPPAVSSQLVQESREALKSLIQLEHRYYRQSNYLSPDSDSCNDDNDLDTGAPFDGRDRSSTLPLDMIAEMASLVTDLQLARESENDDSPTNLQHRRSDRHEAGFSTPELEASSRKGMLRDVRSPNSSTDDIYGGVTQNEVYSSQNSQTTKRRRRRSSLEVSYLSTWRHQMLDWTFNMCQSICSTNGGTIAAVTFSILDRYLSIVLTRQQLQREHLHLDHQIPIPISKEDFQLYCMASLYIAAKLWIPADRNQLTVSALVAISQGYYTKDDFYRQERDILLTLNWHINPPTVMDFIYIYLNVLGSPSDSKTCSTILKKCEYFAELVLDDTFFINKANSVVALAIVLLITDAFRGSNGCGKSHKRRSRNGESATSLAEFLRNVRGVVNIHSTEFDLILRRLECFA